MYGDRFVDQLVPWTTNAPWFWLDKLLFQHLLTPGQSLALAFATAVIALPAATALWAKELDRDWVVAGLLGWWTAWSGMIYWGFFHYSQAIAISVLILAWDRALQREERGAVRVGVAWAVLFVVHLQAWAWTAVLVALQRAVHGLRTGRPELAAAAWAPSALLAAVWVRANLGQASGAAQMGNLEGGLGLRWQSPVRTIGEMVPLMSASFPWTWADEVLGVALLLGGLAGFAWTWSSKRWEAGAVGALAVGLATLTGMILLPAQMQGQFFLSVRLVAFLPPAAAVLASPRLEGPRRQALIAVAAVGAVATMALNHWTLVRWDRESAPAFALMDQIPDRQRVLFFPANRHSEAAIGGVYTHITGWYAAESQGEPNFSFAVFRPNPVVYRDPERHPHTRAGWENRPWCTALAGEARGFDYLLVRGRDPGHHCGVVQRYQPFLGEVAVDGEWALYTISGDLPATPKGDCRCPGL